MSRADGATVGAALIGASARLDGSRVDAELLLAHALSRSRAWLYAHAETKLAPRQSAAFDRLVARRAAGEPVAYLTGIRGFWSLALAVSDAVLIPRPETELLVELALRRIDADREARIVDLGTGSGAIALALARERPRAAVVATDASAAALAVAAANASALGIAQVAFRHGDWWRAVGGERFDLAVSNPPYIAENDPHLDHGDLRFEPRPALVGGPSGLAALAAVVDGAPLHLVPHGWLLVEHGYDQGAAVRALFARAAFDSIATERDLAGHERVTLGRRA